MAEIEVTKSVEWLADNLDRSDLVILDASWHLPPENRNPFAEFKAGHIQGAVFFDLDKHSDPTSTLPHTMPSAEQFGAEMGTLGISNADTVIVYDTVGLFSAARVWWMFRQFGLVNTFVLDGGLPAWKAAGHDLESGNTARAPTSFHATEASDLLVDRQTIIDGFETENAPLIMDARGPGRFYAREAEPRPGMRSGHIPGSVNMHYASLLDDQKRLLPADVLSARFASAGFDPSRQTIASCGSGVTACIILMALTRTGHANAHLYDGSWSEWGGRADTPIATD